MNCFRSIGREEIQVGRVLLKHEVHRNDIGSMGSLRHRASAIRRVGRQWKIGYLEAPWRLQDINELC